MPERNPAIVAISIRNQNFWQAQKALMEAALEDERTFRLVMDLVKSEPLRGVPVYSQTTLHSALDVIEMAKRATLHAETQFGAYTPGAPIRRPSPVGATEENAANSGLFSGVLSRD